MPRWVLLALLALVLLVTSSPGAAAGPLDGVYIVLEEPGPGGREAAPPYFASVIQDQALKSVNFSISFGFFASQALGVIVLDEMGIVQVTGGLFLGDSSVPFFSDVSPYGTFEAQFLPPAACPQLEDFPPVTGCFSASINVNGAQSILTGLRFFGS